jgi:hypothetical protein
MWAWRDALIPHRHHMNHGPSPVIHGDLVLVRSGDGQAIMGLEKATGKVRWETQIQMNRKRGEGTNHGNHVSPLLMELPVIGGGTRTVLITQWATVLDAKSGQKLGNIDKLYGGEYIMVGRSGRLFRGQTGCVLYNMCLKAETLMTTQRPGLLGGGNYGSELPVYGPAYLVEAGGTVYEMLGDATIRVPRQRFGKGRGVPILCGDMVVLPEQVNWYHRNREDWSIATAFSILDLRDSYCPRLLSRRNVLGGSELPNDPIWDTYMRGFDKKLNEGCYYGLAPWFGCRVGGVVAHGSRIYIQSTQGMYCIGPAIWGTAADDPTVAQMIRSAKTREELLKYLTSDSAQYRFEAVKKMAELQKEHLTPPALQEILAETILKDAYEEIRAQAILTLNAADPAGRKGWAVFADDLVDAEKAYKNPWDAVLNERLHFQSLIFRAIQAADKSLLVREMGRTADPFLLRALLRLAGDAAMEDPVFLECALKTWKDKDIRLSRCALDYLAHTAYRDPRARIVLRDYIKTSTAEKAPEYYAALLRRTPESDVPTLLADLLKTNSWHDWPGITDACIRLGTTQSQAILQKAAQDKPDQAPHIADVIKAMHIADGSIKPETPKDKTPVQEDE